MLNETLVLQILDSFALNIVKLLEPSLTGQDMGGIRHGDECVVATQLQHDTKTEQVQSDAVDCTAINRNRSASKLLSHCNTTVGPHS